MKVLEIKGISKYFGGVQALTDVSFKVDSGEVFGLIGPNGAGKTTLFNLLTAIFPPSDGEIVFAGQAVRRMKPHEITQMGMARTFQNIRLFPEMSACDNVMLGQHCRTRAGVWASVLRTKAQRQEELRIREKSMELLRFTGLEQLASEAAGNLSYGQQRRLEIARALATEPRLLLLDEPAAGMNEKETGELISLIQHIKEKQITVLLIEHDMPLVMKVCDRLAVLNFGKCIARGTPEEIQQNPEVIAAYLGQEEDEELA